MSELKTTANNKSVITFLNTIEDQQKREDSFVLLSLFEKVTRQPGVMWGDSIIGFGKYRYTNTKGEHEWMLTGFSPRKQSLTLYIMQGFDGLENLLSSLGKTKHAKSCLYIKKLSDIDVTKLEAFLLSTVSDMKKRYPTE